MQATNFFKIKIDGQQFKKAYLVYVVKLITENRGTFYYIGQTGDRNYATARPAFRRLAGHFSDQGNSTENQVYRQIAVKILGIESASARQAFTQDTKDKVADFLSKCKIEMFVHPIGEFLANDKKHQEKRKLAEKIEQELMNYFVTQVGEEYLFNKKIPKSKTVEYDAITKVIVEHHFRELI